MNFNSIYQTNKVQSLQGRYITLEMIQPILENLSGNLEIIGHSVQNRSIYQYTVGNGSKRLLFWSQMHGNESTATKALMDLLKFLESKNQLAERLLEEFTFCFIPMLNPDGAKAYTRVNANLVDLNRDLINQSQPETKTLIQTLENFQPHYTFNLHDQRSIFGLENSKEPATISFLAPAFDESRTYNTVREKAIAVIIGMTRELNKEIPGKIGRFDDSFNPNCVGDNFTMKGFPTILIESGHYPNDYQREESRRITFIALLSGIIHIHENDIVNSGIEEYLNIPQNLIVFYDFGFKNVKINYDGIDKITNFVAHYKEELIEDKLVFNAYIEDSSNLEHYLTHDEYDAKGAEFYTKDSSFPKIGAKADFQIGNQSFQNAKPQ